MALSKDYGWTEYPTKLQAKLSGDIREDAYRDLKTTAPSLFAQTDPELARYAYETLQPEDEELRMVRESAQKRGLPPDQMVAFDARHLEIFVRLMGAKRVVEIGTLGGYSGIALARGMGAGGRLHTFEVDPYHAEVARAAFARSRHLCEIVMHIGPALENLPTIANEAPFDLVFIDADRANYPAYLAWARDHLRVGGAVIADHSFAWGRVHRRYDLRPGEEREVLALRAFNEELSMSSRWRTTILPTYDGLTVAVKLS